MEEEEKMRDEELKEMSNKMREMVRAQTAVGGDAAGALEEAQTAIIQLFRWEPRFS